MEALMTNETPNTTTPEQRNGSMISAYADGMMTAMEGGPRECSGCYTQAAEAVWYKAFDAETGRRQEQRA
jgi:hypothetical protein